MSDAPAAAKQKKWYDPTYCGGMSPEEVDAFLGSPDSTWLLRLGVLLSRRGPALAQLTLAVLRLLHLVTGILGVIEAKARPLLGLVGCGRWRYAPMTRWAGRPRSRDLPRHRW